MKLLASLSEIQLTIYLHYTKNHIVKIITKEPLIVLVQENNAGTQEVSKHRPYVLCSYYQSKLEKKERKKHKAVHGV